MRRRKGLFWIFIILLIAAAGLYWYYEEREEKEREEHRKEHYNEEEREVSSQMPILDNQNLYVKDNDGEVIHVYVTILEPEKEKHGTLTDILSYQYSYEEEVTKPVAEAVFQLGDEKGPQFGMLSFTPTAANAEIEPRGRSSSFSPYKSFKITLSDKAALWGGQKVLNLNFHPSDKSRVRNKLSFDYLELIPDIPSLRTQFVRLHIKDNSNGEKGEFVDYGLFTHVEQVNKKYLKSHGLDNNGNLYKANSFEFHRYLEVLKLKEDPEYDKGKFEELLEIRGNEDHTKLLEMLNDLNDYSEDIDEVIEEHFNKENYLTWLATNIVMGNADTVSQNFFLYSPQAIQNWYFIPWDYDGAWGWIYDHEEEDQKNLYSEWQYGIQNLWASKLNNRFLRKEENVRELDEKIEEILKICSKEKTKAFLEKYYPEVSKSQWEVEDLVKMRSSREKFQQSYNSLVDIPTKNYQVYLESKEKPMPFFQNPVEMKDQMAKFSWGASYDLQGDRLGYLLEVSKTPDMKTLVYSKRYENKTEDLVKIPKGIYYMKVTAIDEQGHSMVAFDRYSDFEGRNYFGVLEVEVK